MSTEISIVMPTYNRAEFITAAVASVVAQSFQHWQLTIVDDGSTDNTCEVLSDFLKDPRIQYFYQDNAGQSIARNRGIAESSAPWICFLDSDNLWPVDKLSKNIAVAKSQPEMNIFYGEIGLIDINSNALPFDGMRRHSGMITCELLKDNFITINTVMIKNDCLKLMGAFDESDRLAEDYELWLRLSTRYSFFYINHLLAYYRVMPNQISSDKEKRFESNQKILQSFRTRFPRAVTPVQWRVGMSHFYSRRAGYRLACQNYWRCMIDTCHAITAYPFRMGPWKLIAKLILERVKTALPV